jgi:hypothetical protein
MQRMKELWERFSDSTPGKGRLLDLRDALGEAVKICGSDDLRAIVFVQQSICTHVLKNFLANDPQLQRCLRPQVLHASGSKSAIMTKESSVNHHPRRLSR